MLFQSEKIPPPPQKHIQRISPHPQYVLEQGVLIKGVQHTHEMKSKLLRVSFLKGSSSKIFKQDHFVTGQ